MGEVHAEITLRNGGDIIMAERGHIPEQKIRSLTVTTLVDTGATMLVMGEKTREKLGLVITETDSVALADGTLASCGITEPVEIRWEDRKSTLRACVMPGDEEILLGFLPLEEMDLMVDPLSQQLTRPARNRLRTGYMRKTRP